MDEGQSVYGLTLCCSSRPVEQSPRVGLILTEDLCSFCLLQSIQGQKNIKRLGCSFSLSWWVINLFKKVFFSNESNTLDSLPQGQRVNQL